MAFAASSLPRDPDILIEMIAGLRAENDKLRAMLETLKRAFVDGCQNPRLSGDFAISRPSKPRGDVSGVSAI